MGRTVRVSAFVFLTFLSQGCAAAFVAPLEDHAPRFTSRIARPSQGPFVAAFGAFEQGRWAAAADGFHRARANDPALAQFWVARSLQEAGYDSAALSRFSALAAQDTPYRAEALAWVVSLGRDLPEEAEVLSVIAGISDADLIDARFDPIRDELEFFVGRTLYRRGELERAVLRLAEVRRDGPYFPEAQIIMGVAESRLFHIEPARAAFQSVVADVEAKLDAEAPKVLRAVRRHRERIVRLGEIGKTERADRLRERGPRGKATRVDQARIDRLDRLRDQAHMGLGYLRYQAGEMEAAAAAFAEIEVGSPLHADALFASAWTEFRLVESDSDHANRHYQRTLGHVHSLRVPRFADRVLPEALALRATTYYYNCRYALAKRAVEELNAELPVLLGELREVLDHAEDDSELVRVFEASGSARVRGLGEDETARRHREHVQRVSAELARLENDGPMRGSAVGEELEEELVLLASASTEAAGAVLRQRIGAAAAEVRRVQREGIRIEYQILERLKRMPPRPRPKVAGRLERPPVDSEHELYNYDGTVWDDELGYYYYKVTSICEE